DKPTVRSLDLLVARTSAAVGNLGYNSLNRLKIASAAPVASCWEIIDSTSTAKCWLFFFNLNSPTVPMISESTGSFLRNFTASCCFISSLVQDVLYFGIFYLGLDFIFYIGNNIVHFFYCKIFFK